MLRSLLIACTLLSPMAVNAADFTDNTGLERLALNVPTPIQRAAIKQRLRASITSRLQLTNLQECIAAGECPADALPRRKHNATSGMQRLADCIDGQDCVVGHEAGVLYASNHLREFSNHARTDPVKAALELERQLQRQLGRPSYEVSQNAVELLAKKYPRLAILTVFFSSGAATTGRAYTGKPWYQTVGEFFDSVAERVDDHVTTLWAKA